MHVVENLILEPEYYLKNNKNNKDLVNVLNNMDYQSL
jgi:hypothetical protein